MFRLGLTTGKVRGDHLVHLFDGSHQESLCRQTRRMTVPTAGFRAAPCDECLTHALEEGHVAARDHGNVYLNLQRIPRQAQPA
jgi:hypothetical protein